MPLNRKFAYFRFIPPYFQAYPALPNFKANKMQTYTKNHLSANPDKSYFHIFPNSGTLISTLLLCIFPSRVLL